MTKHSWKVTAVVLLGIGGASCDKLKPPLPAIDKPAAVPAGSAGATGAERAALAQAAEKELEELRGLVAELKLRIGNAKTDSKARLSADMEKMESELRVGQERLRELKSATGESWSQINDAFVASRTRLKQAVDNFRHATQ